MNYILKSENIFTENKHISGYITICDGIITQIKEQQNEIEKNLLPPESEIIDLGKIKIIPGLIDIHIHGGNGYDVMDSTYEAINEISKFKLNQGVTSFCPTTVTSPQEKTEQAIKNIVGAIKKGVDGSKIIGIFLEGPYINKKNKGAHPEQFIREIDFEEIQKLINIGEGNVKSIAIAPELPNAIQTIKKLTDQGINVRIGHSSATSDETILAVENGANISIHTYNAMSPLNHRNPGMVGACMACEDIYNEVICDLVHVEKTAIKALINAKKEKIILITDCMCAGGLDDGIYKLGELEVYVKNSEARLQDGTLAGSTLDLMKAFKNTCKDIGVDFSLALKMATINPAKALGIDDKIGSIQVGKKADIIGIDENFDIKFKMLDGKIFS